MVIERMRKAMQKRINNSLLLLIAVIICAGFFLCINSTVYAADDTTPPTGSISSTNDVASSQKVTLYLSDNIGVAGYYWGTSSYYSNNSYTEIIGRPGSYSVTISVSDSGTYYLNVKDTLGHALWNDIIFECKRYFRKHFTTEDHNIL